MTFLKVFAFSLLSLLVFTVFANILPQVQSDPPKEETLDTGSMDMAGMIAFGERLFRGKGTCTLCHNELGRAPDMLNLDLTADFASRLADPAYAGAAKGKTGARAFEIYIRESMQDPSIYVVPGFGKKGTNDTVSPMPRVDAPPIELTEVEMNAVIAFLQDRAGVKPTVPLPSAEEAPAAEPAATAQEEDTGPLTDPVEIIDSYGCAACHDLNGSEADLGPDLRGVGTRLSREEIARAIYDPDATIAEGYEPGIMPQDFGERMRVSELNLLVDYLASLK